MEPDAMILVFWMLSFKPGFSFSSFTFIKRLFSSYSLSTIWWCHLHIWGYWYFSLQSWFQLVLHPAWHFTWCTLHSKLNRQGDNIQPWRTPIPIWNQSFVPCPVLTVAFWPAYRFFKGQVRWSGIPISFRIFHTVKAFGIVNKAEVDVFLEFSCSFDDPADAGNLISGLPAFSKSAWTSGSSWFTYYWSLAWRILCITLLACEVSSNVQ